MTVRPDDLFALLGKMRMDLSQLQARVTELQSMLSALNLPEPKGRECPRCGVDFPAELALLDHLVLVHEDAPAEERRERLWSSLGDRAACAECELGGGAHAEGCSRAAVA